MKQKYIYFSRKKIKTGGPLEIIWLGPVFGGGCGKSGPVCHKIFNGIIKTDIIVFYVVTTWYDLQKKKEGINRKSFYTGDENKYPSLVKYVYYILSW